MTNLTILKPERRPQLAAKVRDRPSDIVTARIVRIFLFEG
jgi:hypothetical protein